MKDAPMDYERELDDWKAARLSRLKSPEGWLNITDRLWLPVGSGTLGSDPLCDLVLSAGPGHVGTMVQTADGRISFEPADGGPSILLAGDDTASGFVIHGDLLLEITSTNGRNAVRVHDVTAPARHSFDGLDYFPPSPDWRLTARWQPLPEPRTMSVGSSMGINSDVQVTHQAEFVVATTPFTLLATHGSPSRPQFVFSDLTTGSSTYAGGRFLFGEDVTADSIIVDFNKAFNPPCSFSQHANCPLPVKENVLPIRIEAGEKRHAFNGGA